MQRPMVIISFFLFWYGERGHAIQSYRPLYVMNIDTAFRYYCPDFLALAFWHLIPAREIYVIAHY